MMKNGLLKKLALGATALTLATAVTGCGGLLGGKEEGTIVVMGKNFTEQDIMANIVAQALEANTDLKIDLKSYLGGTDVVFNAIKTGSGDIYVEYSGTGLMNILGEDLVNDPDEAHQIVKDQFKSEYNLEYLQPFGFNNTYAVAVPTELANKYGLKTTSDIAKVSNELVFGTEQEFLDRPDGMPGFKKTYNLNFKDVKAMDTGLKYKALGEKQVDAINAFTTDGRLLNYDVVILEDDKNFFPPYYAAPVVRAEVLEKHPEIGEVLSKLEGTITEEEMIKLNAQVDVDKKKASDVAAAWLKEEGIVK